MVENNPIHIDNSSGTLKTAKDTTLSFGKEILIGDGTNPDLYDENNKVEEGLLCVRMNKQNLPELWQSNKKGIFEPLGEPYDDSSEIIFPIIMGS